MLKSSAAAAEIAEAATTAAVKAFIVQAAVCNIE
jgi:hypothetical protein